MCHQHLLVVIHHERASAVCSHCALCTVGRPTQQWHLTTIAPSHELPTNTRRRGGTGRRMKKYRGGGENVKIEKNIGEKTGGEECVISHSVGGIS